MSKKKRRGRLPSVKKIEFSRCKNCPLKYYGVEKDAKTGKILRVFDCRKDCILLKKTKPEGLEL